MPQETQQTNPIATTDQGDDVQQNISVVSNVAETVKDSLSSSAAAQWVTPVILLLAVAGLGWFFLRKDK